MVMIISVIPHQIIIFHRTNHNFQNTLRWDNIILMYKIAHHTVLIKSQITKVSISLMIAVVQLMLIKCTKKVLMAAMENLASDVAVSRRKELL